MTGAGEHDEVVHISTSPWQRAAISAFCGLVVVGIGWIGGSVMDLQKTQAQMQTKLAIIVARQQSISDIAQRVATLQVRVERNSSDIRDMRNAQQNGEP